GPVLEEAIAVVERKEIPEHITPEKGMQLQVGGEQGMFEVTITQVTDTHVTMDGNHPLAGKDLTFELELVSIK
ncbi:MAG: peptidylprolyl isomerase, partial [Spirochaetia bacterium]|nr:peptidylprolyl isomerase [Spirochaetia bacterium]